MEYILWRYRNLSAIVYTTWRRPKHGGDRMLAGNTYGFRGIFVFVKIFLRNFCEHCFRKIMRRFRIFCFIHFREISGKQLCERPTEILSFFRETFRLLETLVAMI